MSVRDTSCVVLQLLAKVYTPMIIPGQMLRAIRIDDLHIVEPFVERTVFNGKSFGLSSAGYDIRARESVELLPSNRSRFQMCSSLERFQMPDDVLGIVHDKSTWARLGVAVQNTVIEPGWQGFLTLELTLHANQPVFIEAGEPVAQIVFHKLLEPAEKPYAGKYQNQEAGPQPARFEK